jgi:hypothetical protein
MRSRGGWCRLAVLLGAAALAGPPDSACGQAPDSIRVAAGPDYRADGVKRWLLGSDYRDLWTTPVAVPYLDLATTAGGLTPISAGGGMQTKSLWFRGADGYQYAFRSVAKGVKNIPPILQGTVVERLAQDQNSSQYPAGPLLVAPLAHAAGLMEAQPRLVALPDDPALGPFRERFRETVGYLERRLTVEPGLPGPDGALEIIDTDDLLDRIDAGPADRVDVRTYLRARLFDVWIGDRDRHQGQWTWARFTNDPSRVWVPIPEDRDQAFVRFDGVVLWLARQITGQYVDFDSGELLKFGARYSHVIGTTWSARVLDRRLLVELPWEAWESVVQDLQACLTDSVIAAAVRAQPAEYYALRGAWLAQMLQARRAELPAFARRFYRLLAEEVELTATDVSELITVTRRPGGESALEIAPREHPDTPYVRRNLDAAESRELRLITRGGADSVVVRGQGPGIRIRVLGGGAAVVIDSSDAGRVSLLAPGGADRAGGVRAVSVDRRPYRPPFASLDGRPPPRDWGGDWDPAIVVQAGPDIGLLAGGGPRYTRYGFWKYPYAYRVQARLAVATGPPTVAGDLRVSAYRLNSRVRWDVDVRGTGLDVLRFHGLGNETELLVSDPEYYRVRQRVFEVAPAIALPLASRAMLRLGATASYTRTRADSNRIIGDTKPYGSGNFGEVGLTADVQVDALRGGAAAASGAALVVEGRLFPAVWDVDSGFADLHATATAHIGTEAAPLHPVLALRAGGKVVFGTYPFQEAAYIGDPRTVRLGRQNRYGGDAAVWGGAELRLQLVRFGLILPAALGAYGLADVGRVFVAGESSTTWHPAWGGGLTLTFLTRANTACLEVVRSEERTVVYARLGYLY